MVFLVVGVNMSKKRMSAFALFSMLQNLIGKGGATKSDDFWKIKEVGEIIPTTPASSRAHIESEELRKLVYGSQNSTKRLVIVVKYTKPNFGTFT